MKLFWFIILGYLCNFCQLIIPLLIAHKFNIAIAKVCVGGGKLFTFKRPFYIGIIPCCGYIRFITPEDNLNTNKKLFHNQNSFFKISLFAIFLICGILFPSILLGMKKTFSDLGIIYKDIWTSITTLSMPKDIYNLIMQSSNSKEAIARIFLFQYSITLLPISASPCQEILRIILENKWPLPKYIQTILASFCLPFICIFVFFIYMFFKNYQ